MSLAKLRIRRSVYLITSSTLWIIFYKSAKSMKNKKMNFKPVLALTSAVLYKMYILILILKLKFVFKY